MVYDFSTCILTETLHKVLATKRWTYSATLVPDSPSLHSMQLSFSKVTREERVHLAGCVVLRHLCGGRGSLRSESSWRDDDGGARPQVATPLLFSTPTGCTTRTWRCQVPCFWPKTPAITAQHQTMARMRFNPPFTQPRNFVLSPRIIGCKYAISNLKKKRLEGRAPFTIIP